MRVFLAACLMALVLAVSSGSARAAMWTSGGLTFSDELGGFRLISVSGSGTIADPIVIVEELRDVAPAVLVIRGKPVNDGKQFEIPRFIHLAVIKIVVNSSKRVWAGFDLELQEVLKMPSSYGDGLSFDQIGSFGAAPFRSDSFAISDRLSEPYDRVSYLDGHVDPGATARFNFVITDPTPAAEFYLVQEPRLLIAERPPDAPADMVQQAAR